MTHNRDKLASLDLELEELGEKQDALSTKNYELNVSREAILKEIFAEEKPFDGTTWEFFVDISSSMFLQYVEGNTEQVEDLHKLCIESWHDSFKIEEGVTLHFDDGVYSLHASDPGQLRNFAQKQNLKIVAKDIDDKIKRLSRQLTNLQEICHQFNLKI